MMFRATDLAHLLIRRVLEPGDWALDATAGNGHDTLLLAERVGPSGRVFSFDIQEAALAQAAQRAGHLPQVSFIQAGHERLADFLPDTRPDGRPVELAAAMFNLGYLPGGAKDMTTQAGTTIAALDQVLDRLKPHGLVTLVLYPGHAGGAEEAAAVRAHAKRLGGDFSVSCHARLNAARPAPELVTIERTGPAPAPMAG